VGGEGGWEWGGGVVGRMMGDGGGGGRAELRVGGGGEERRRERWWRGRGCSPICKSFGSDLEDTSPTGEGGVRKWGMRDTKQKRGRGR